MATYSFLTVQATLSGPGGNISIGSSSGAAKEGITTTMLEEKDLATVGADGSLMHSLRAGNAARISVRLLKTSPINKLLSQLYNLQRLSPSLWGNNVLAITDTNRGDVVVGDTIAFVRQADLTYAEDGGMNEWQFVGNITELLG